MSAAPTRVVLLGGTSEIGLAILRRMAGDRPLRVVLVGRDRDALAAAVDGLQSGGSVQAAAIVADLDALEGHAATLREAREQLGAVDLVVLAVGRLGGQEAIDADPAGAAEVLRVNLLVAGALMHASLRLLCDQSAGTLVVLSSVAGVRVRASNAFYGAAKAGLDGLAAGLADAARAHGVRTLVVRPGFVVGRMTEGLRHPPLATTPAAVADATVRGLARGRDTVWAPASIGVVFSILRVLPRAVWRRLPL